jgi:hypothetical protein
MSVTIIPAPDMSGATAGWEMLSRAVQLNRAREQQKQAAYQDLVIKLSDPTTTEDQQNAILTQDPAQFKITYGVPIEQVGKDIARFQKSAKDIVAPNGMVLQGQEFVGNKRVLVEHPEGTAQEQQQRATLTGTIASTEAEKQRAAANASQAELNKVDQAMRMGKFVVDIKDTTRTVAGKVPNNNQVREYLNGNLELIPTTAGQKKLEAITEILGVDQSTPAGRIAMHDFATQQNYSDEQLNAIRANVRNMTADAALRERELEMLNQGLDRQGKPLDKGVDPKEIMAIGKGFTDAFNGALGPLGFPTKSTTAGAEWWKIDYLSSSTKDNPALLPAIFGNGAADPAAVRRDLLAAIPAGRKLKTIGFPSFDTKTNRPITVSLNIDEAVPQVTQMRRTLTTTMPPVFAALRQASPQSLLYMAANNPLIEQMAKAYAPDVAAMIADARKAEADTPPPPAANAAPVDENLSTLTNDMIPLQKEVDDLYRMLGEKAGAAPSGQ